MAYDSWKSHDEQAERSGDGEDVIAYSVPRYWLKLSYDRGLNVTVATLLKLEYPSKGWQRVSESIVDGDEADAVRALRESRHHASAWSRARRVRELKARGELDRRVPTWVG